MAGNEITVKVKRIGAADMPLPTYATAGSAGLDLAARLDAPVTVLPGERVRIPTGIAVQLPQADLTGLVFARSGLAAKHGLTMANGVGVIDADYTGEIICVLQNNGSEAYTINPGDRIAQLVFVPIARANLIVVDELAATERGADGFGSTGQ